MPPEGLVSYAVDDGADGPRQNLHDNVTGKQRIRVIPGEPEQQSLFEERLCIRCHAQQHLETVENDGVSGLPGIFTGRFCSEHNSEIGVEDDEPDNDQVEDVGDVPLLDDVRVWEGSFPQTEHLRIEEVQRLRGQCDKEIRKDGKHAGGPDQTDQQQRPPDGADLHVAKREADGDVALQGHAGQVQRRVLGGDESQQDEDAAEGHVDLVEDVADDEEHHRQHHLDHVIDHQVKKQDVTRIGVEDLRDGATRTQTASQTTPGN